LIKVHSNMKKYLIISFSALLVMFIVFFYFIISKKQVSIVHTDELVEVKQGDLEVEIESTGELNSMKSNAILAPNNLFSDFNINQITIKSILPEGTVVKRGDIIANLDESAYNDFKSKIDSEITGLKNNINNFTDDTTKQLKNVRLAMENAQIDIEIKKIAVDQSLFDPPATHERLKLEFKKSQLAYDDAQKNYHDLRISLLEKFESYQSKLDSLLNLEKTKLPVLLRTLNIQSPFNGVISYTLTANGTKRAIGSTLTMMDNTVATIDDPGSFISNCYIEEDYYSKIQIGQKITIVLKTSGKEIDATIGFIDNKMEMVNGKKCFAIGTYLSSAENELILNQTTINRISLPALKNVIYVPTPSVLTEGKKSYVISEKGSKLQVTCEKGNEDFMVIITGLTPGQRIYVNAVNAANN